MITLVVELCALLLEEGETEREDLSTGTSGPPVTIGHTTLGFVQNKNFL